MLSEFLSFYLIFLVAMVSPGPDFLLVTKNAMLYSKKDAILTSLGIAAGNAVHIFYLFIGLGFLISKSIFLFSIIKYAGAAYLLYLAYKLIRSEKEQESESLEKGKKEKRHNSFWEGFIACVLNPKLALFLISFFGQIVKDFQGDYFAQFLAGATIVGTAFFYFSLIGLFFQSSFVQGVFQKVQHKLNKVFGGLLVLLGIKIVFSE